MLYVILAIVFYWLMCGVVIYRIATKYPIDNKEAKDEPFLYLLVCLLFGGIFLPAAIIGHYLSRKQK